MARSICSISLPEPLQRYVEKRVRCTGYLTVGEYVRALILDDQQRFGDAVEMAEIRQEAPPPRPQLASAARSRNATRWNRG